jgi:hypothetical protein
VKEPDVASRYFKILYNNLEKSEPSGSEIAAEIIATLSVGGPSPDMKTFAPLKFSTGADFVLGRNDRVQCSHWA